MNLDVLVKEIVDALESRYGALVSAALSNAYCSIHLGRGELEETIRRAIEKSGEVGG